MNKARITYRFDGDKDKRNDGADDAGNGREPNRVIPLFQEEYQVVEEQKGPGVRRTIGGRTGLTVPPSSGKSGTIRA
jgi:hypothetical protein